MSGTSSSEAKMQIDAQIETNRRVNKAKLKKKSNSKTEPSILIEEAEPV